MGNEDDMQESNDTGVGAKQVPAVQPSEGLRVLVSIIVFGFGLLGFLLIKDISGRFLWFSFVVVAYPPTLAVIVHPPSREETILKMYLKGLSLIPAIGDILTRLNVSWPSGTGRNRPDHKADDKNEK